jgi:membrane protein DedA with SNARE-associated domain
MAPATGMNGSTNYNNTEFAYSNGVSSIIQTGSLTTIVQHLSAVISWAGDPWAPSAKSKHMSFLFKRESVI